MSEKTDCPHDDAVYFDITEFLTEYKKFPSLWDKNHELFKDKKARINAEEILCEKLGYMDLYSLRKKIRSVCDTYNTEIRKIKMSLENGTEVHIPKLSWFHLAYQFLRSTTELSPDIVYVVDEAFNDCDEILERNRDKIEEPNSPHSELKQDIKNCETRIDKNEISDQEELLDDFNSTDEPELNITESISSNGSKHQRNEDDDDDDDYDECIRNISKNLREIVYASENEFLVFGRCIGTQLQKLPLDLALQLQMDIQSQVTKVRIDYLRKKQRIEQWVDGQL